jgi:hypothetical protein
MLLRKYGQRQTACSCGLAQEGVAHQRIAETSALTISDCLGPCDIPNIVTISNETGTLWLGGITEFNEYQALVDWAGRSRDAGELLPLPKQFRQHT